MTVKITKEREHENELYISLGNFVLNFLKGKIINAK